MSAGSQIDWGTNVPIYDPDGRLHAVSQDPGMIKAALAQPGAKRAIPVLAPTGEHHWIPEDQMHDALGAGGRIDFPSHDIAKWYGFSPSNVLSNTWQQFKGFYTGAKDIAVDLASNPNWVSGTPERPSTLEKFVEQPMEQQVVKAGQAFNQGDTLAGVGHGLASGVPLIGPWAASLGEQAGSGDIGGAVGGAAGTYAAVKAPAAVGAVANQVLPSRIRAQAGLDRVANSSDTPQAPNFDSTAKRISDADAKIAQYGGPPLPDTVRALQGRAIALGSPSSGATPPTFVELYEHLKAINKSLYVDRSVPKSLEPEVKTIAQSLANDLSAATKEMPRGYSRLWDQSLNEYHHAMQMTRTANVLGPIIGGAVGFGLGRNIGRAIDAPLAGELASGYAGRMVGKPLAGSIVRSITGREMPPVPPGAPLPQGTAYRVGQAAGKVRNFMTGSVPPAPPEAITSPVPPPTSTTPPPMPPVSAPPSNMPTAASRAASDLAFQQNYPKGVVPGKPMDPIAQRAWDESLGFRKPESDIGAKARTTNPEPTRAQTKGAKKPPPPPPKPLARNLPPEAYTRFLLEAKNGEISNGELERRFAKYGGSGVRPLRRG